MTTNSMAPAEAWSTVAAAWDRNAEYVDGPTVGTTARLLEQVAAGPGDRILELAAGPGTLSSVWSQLVGPTGSVVVTDVAPAMVEVATRRAAGLANVETAVVDASDIAWPDATFDVVASRMGLMFTPDPAVAFAEMRRVLKPGGRLGALTWGAIEHNPWMTCVGMAAMATGLVSGGPPTGPGGIFSLGDPARLEALAKEAGFVDVAVETISVTFAADSVDAHIDRVSALAGPLAAVLQAASPDQRAALRRTATDLAAPYVTNDGVEMPGRAVLVSGRR